MFVIGGFDVTIRRVGTQRFTGFTLCFEYRTDFLACVLGVPFVCVVLHFNGVF
jgi:hypothetical protein